MSDLQLNTNELQVSISYNCATISKNRTQFRGLSGSSRYQGRYNNYLYEQKEVKSKNVPRGTSKQNKEVEPKGLNKSKLKRKIEAFFRLKQTQKFCAFYSVSFPLFMPDKSAVKVLNNVLTTLRSNSLKFQYIWVAERQKNGTIHFHILLNRFLNIRLTNGLFAKAIENELKASELNHINFNKSKYNGCDVKYVRTEKNLKSYITKYVSKNEEKFKVRSWACSQVVSRMFTSVSYHFGEVDLHEALFYFDRFDNVVCFGDSFFTCYPLKKPPSSRLMSNLEKANELIANGYEGLEPNVQFNNEKTGQIPADVVDNQNEQLTLAF